MSGFYGPKGRLHGRKPIQPVKSPPQASGLADSFKTGQTDAAMNKLVKKGKRKLRNIGNDLLPGNPFG